MNHRQINFLREDREKAFEQLYRQGFPQVARMIKGLGGSYQDARDTFQDALVILYEKAVEGRLEIRSTASAYVVGIAKHLWVRQQRENSHLLAFSQMEKEIDVPDTFYEPLEKPKLRLFHYLEVAGRKCLDILQAFYYQRMPLRQIAEEFGFANTRSATVQKHKCLEKVRAEVKNKKESYEEMVA